MKPNRTILALTLALLAGGAAAVHANPGDTGALPVPANRIVGLWTTTVNVGACQGGPVMTIHGASVFHAGGTLGETNTSSPTTRGPGQGVWRHTGRGQYKTKFRFFAYLPDGSFDGVREISTTTILNARATQYDATVRARFYNPNGSVRVDLCGSATGERVPGV